MFIRGNVVIESHCTTRPPQSTLFVIQRRKLNDNHVPYSRSHTGCTSPCPEIDPIQLQVHLASWKLSKLLLTRYTAVIAAFLTVCPLLRPPDLRHVLRGPPTHKVALPNFPLLLHLQHPRSAYPLSDKRCLLFSRRQSELHI